MEKIVNVIILATTQPLLPCHPPPLPFYHHPSPRVIASSQLLGAGAVAVGHARRHARPLRNVLEDGRELVRYGALKRNVGCRLAAGAKLGRVVAGR